MSEENQINNQNNGMTRKSGNGATVALSLALLIVIALILFLMFGPGTSTKNDEPTISIDLTENPSSKPEETVVDTEALLKLDPEHTNVLTVVTHQFEEVQYLASVKLQRPLYILPDNAECDEDCYRGMAPLIASTNKNGESMAAGGDLTLLKINQEKQEVVVPEVAEESSVILISDDSVNTNDQYQWVWKGKPLYTYMGDEDISDISNIYRDSNWQLATP